MKKELVKGLTKWFYAGVAISFKAGHGMIHCYPFLALMFDVKPQKQWTKSASLSERSFLIK